MKMKNSCPKLAVCPQQQVSILPPNNLVLSILKLPAVSISPETSRNLKFSNTHHLDIPPFSMNNPTVPRSLQSTNATYLSPNLPQDPDLAEMNRQENVRNTLQMIDDALEMLNR